MIYTSKTWQHEIKIPFDDYKNIEEMEQWCNEYSSKYRFQCSYGHRQLKLKNNNFVPDFIPHTFWFEREEDANWFALRWV